MFRKLFTTTNNTNTDDDAMILSAPLELRGVVTQEGSDRNIKLVHDSGSRVHATFTFTSRGMMDGLELGSDWTEDFRVRRRRFSSDALLSEKAFAIDVSIPTIPFFRYYCEIDENQFETMKKKQKLSVSLNAQWVFLSLNDFYLAVKESLVSCKTRESTNVMMFTVNGTDGMGNLACFEDLGNKLVETLRIDFVPYTKREIQERVQLEYREMAKTLYGEEEEYAAPFAAPRRR
mmetsp:Transcript_3352/g.11372  ORF Transcript_3352/g.11372 Transcript_3352/m.11372 type:complete len:233 (-) Transcript_3352:669-1367(-)